ncbi:MAG: hypothetical protein GY714_28190 [Desulfobacterales bacterium]|nr:hypothetical protein [Desulfobacterales bacterium]MCP4161856.1 hypothetical protein [Deltaproteobacteria bacterium]
MKNFYKLLVIILLITFCNYGCFQRWTVHSNTIADLDNEIISDEIYFTIDHIFESNAQNGDLDKKYGYRDKIISLLSKKGIKAIYCNKRIKNIPDSYISVKIIQKSFGGAGMSFLTGLSFGVIPSWEGRPDYVSIQVNSINKGVETNNRIISADFHLFIGIILLPLYFLSEDELDEIPPAIVDSMIELSISKFTSDNGIKNEE